MVDLKAQSILQLLEGDDPVRSHANALEMIAAAVAFLRGRLGEQGVIDMLISDAQTVAHVGYLERHERPFGTPLH